MKIIVYCWTLSLKVLYRGCFNKTFMIETTVNMKYFFFFLIFFLSINLRTLFVLQTFCSGHQEKSYNGLRKYKTSCFDECRKGLKSKGHEQKVLTKVDV